MIQDSHRGLIGDLNDLRGVSPQVSHADSISCKDGLGDRHIFLHLIMCIIMCLFFNVKPA